MDSLARQFQKDYPAPAPGVQEQFDAAVQALGAVIAVVEPNGQQPVVVRLSGHANQSDVRGASIVVSVGQAA